MPLISENGFDQLDPLDGVQCHNQSQGQPTQYNMTIQLPIIVQVANYHEIVQQEAIDVIIKAGSDAPALDMIAYDALGSPIDFSSATSVVFRAKAPGAATDKVSGSVAFLDAVNGSLRYQWKAADIDTPGYYMGEVVVQWPDGTETICPTADWIGIKILGDA